VKCQPETRRLRTRLPVSDNAVPASPAALFISAGVAVSIGSVSLGFLFASIPSSACLDASESSMHRYGPRRLRHEEDGRAQQEVHNGTELRIRTRHHPVSQIVVSVPGGVAEDGNTHKLPAEVRVHVVERYQRG